MAALFITLGLGAKAKAQELKEKGRTVNGTVIGHEIQHGSKNKKTYYLKVTWSEEGSATPRVGDRFTVKKAYYEAHMGTNSGVSVRYIPGKKDSAVLEGGSTNFGGMEWLGYVIGAVSVTGAFFSFRKPRQVVA